MGPEFFQTPMGHRFYEGTIPRMVIAVERMADEVARLTAAVERLNQNLEKARADADGAAKD